MSQMDGILAVVVTYNRLKRLQECIDACELQTVPCHILIVDNASTDGTEIWCRGKTAENSSIYYMNTGQNVGGAGGFCEGMKWAAHHGYEYVWIMDDDTGPRHDALKELVKAAELLEWNFGYLSSAVFWTDGTACRMNRQKIQQEYSKYLKYLEHGMIQVRESTFVSLLINVKAIQKVGLPYKEYFIWNDDIEYTYRISSKYSDRCFMVGKSHVIHKMTANDGTDIARDDIERLPRYTMAIRNEANTYRKRGIKGIAKFIILRILDLGNILNHAKGHRARRVFSIICGMINGLGFRPKIKFL